MSKFYPLGTKNKRNFFVGIKTSNFILQGWKPKLIIKVRTKNIFYPIFNLDNSNMRDRSKAMLKKAYFFGRHRFDEYIPKPTNKYIPKSAPVWRFFRFSQVWINFPNFFLDSSDYWFSKVVRTDARFGSRSNLLNSLVRFFKHLVWLAYLHKNWYTTLGPYTQVTRACVNKQGLIKKEWPARNPQVYRAVVKSKDKGRWVCISTFGREK
jgi:hypothetical protein